MSRKFVYFFGADRTEGNESMTHLLGGKGANLGTMSSLGIDVPPGFTITTEACREYFENKNRFSEGLWDEIQRNLGILEEVMDKQLGSRTQPLLVSVRSGANVSMPGMMDTVINLGLNDNTLSCLADNTHNERFALDCYRRFISMFGNVVLGIEWTKFESVLTKQKTLRKVKFDTDLEIKDIKSIIQKFKNIVKKSTEKNFPDDPRSQLRLAIKAAFNSWNTERAVIYRKLNNIPHDVGTAVNIQAMVFGNMGEASATGVAFTRNPATGEKKFYGEYMVNSQGEDVVAGIRTPLNIENLQQEMPEAHSSLETVFMKLEKNYKDMQDIEFTIENGKLYLLQTRSGKRTAAAAIKIAVDMVNEGLISKQEALMRIPADQLDHIFHPMIDPKIKTHILAKGLGASPGAATGKIVFTPKSALDLAEKKERVILVRMETSPEDINGMNVAQGILTARGGMTSHAAVVARAMGKPCVSGCGGLDVNIKKKKATLNKKTIKEYDPITIDGSQGLVLKGKVPLTRPRLTSSFSRVMSWAGEARTLKIRANADTPHDALVARDFGAQGIGLCRTEHMFFDEERIFLFRKMIISDQVEGRREAIKGLLPIQRSDFSEIFKIMEGLPVTIRLLDPPLHEFLPHSAPEIKILAKEMKISPTALKKKIDVMTELNPMLGHRGCRLGITFPEIYQMQTRAIIEAACKLVKKKIRVFPEIMIPLVGHVDEFDTLRELVIKEAEEVTQKANVSLKYKVGTMIELPRAALTADEIAVRADFFSFGTNDLTQTTLGLSRDDAGSFLPFYIERGLLPLDPFVTMDTGGVGELLRIAVEKGRPVNKNLHIGVCGEHGGDPASIQFFHQLGLDYVSCSPFRVPTALLAAAQAAIANA
ncbi:MAG: pyruvate, phosphate dikinase [Nitrospinaceae bacterium]|jgi:pyruvate,orthophosphate dikinase|nr:pyruvate, phosphate dikinase [Nitrospinaceae bacterium]